METSSVKSPAHPTRDLAWLGVVALVVIASGLGLRDPWPTDEPRFAMLSQHMVDTGRWLFPERGGELYSDKPPVFMWLQGLFIQLTGSLRVGFLLPSLFASLGTVALVYDLGRRLWTRRVGLHAAWLLLFTLQFTFQAKRAQIDPTVVFLITLANYGLIRHLLRGPDWRMWCLGWFAAGLGTVTKGVGALALLMLLPAAMVAAARWRGVSFGGWRGLLLGPPAFVLATLVWLGPMLWAVATRGDPALHDYVRTILFHQTVNRYAGSWDHFEPWWYYLGVMLTLWLPAALALPWALPAWWRRLRRKDPRYLLPLAWIALIVLFFSFPAGKRDVYIMPALPMLCLAMAPLAAGLLRRQGLQRLALAFVLGLGGLLLVAGLAVLVADPGFERKLMLERGVVAAEMARLAWLLVGVGGWALACAIFFRRRRAPLAIAWMLGGLWVAYSFVAYPVLDRHSSPRQLMADVAARIGPDAELGLVAWREQMVLVAGRPVQTFGFGKQASWGRPWHEQWNDASAWQAAQPGNRWVLSLELAMPDCVDRSQAILAGIANRRRWWLVPAAAVPAGCRAPVVTRPTYAGTDDAD